MAGGVEEVQSSCEVGLVRVVLAAPRGAVEGPAAMCTMMCGLSRASSVRRLAAVEDVAFVVLVVEDRVLMTVGGGAGESMGLPAFLFTGCHEMAADHSCGAGDENFHCGECGVRGYCQRLSLTGWV